MQLMELTGQLNRSRDRDGILSAEILPVRIKRSKKKWDWGEGRLSDFLNFIECDHRAL